MGIQEFEKSGRFNDFKLDPLISSTVCGDFDCGMPEYNEYLFRDALRSLDDHVAFTWLLIEEVTGKTVAYMSLIMDAIKLSFADVEHDGGVLAFYEKNGFVLNAELGNKNRKTVSMRKDLYS
jgi:hypothetical protein